MDAYYRDRVFLFLIALGNEGVDSTINAAQNKMGNSVVGKQVKDFGTQQFLDSIPICVERLDDLVDIVEAPLMKKLDAQGFECYIIADGMSSVLKKTHGIKTEVAKQSLVEQV
mmetsp:Transcript_28378/g.46949  ORF Transcript_28378/g.46949 Transcript_28378/m.46949 type:complete len:113 (-) Transcript_28378:259-597(-)